MRSEGYGSLLAKFLCVCSEYSLAYWLFHAITFEQKKIHELKTEKSLYQCCTYLFFSVEPSHVFTSVVTDTHTDTTSYGPDAATFRRQGSYGQLKATWNSEVVSYSSLSAVHRYPFLLYSLPYTFRYIFVNACAFSKPRTCATAF